MRRGRPNILPAAMVLGVTSGLVVSLMGAPLWAVGLTALLVVLIIGRTDW